MIKIPPPILVNKEIKLIDGTHRIAMCLWQNIYEVRVKVIPTRANIVYPDQIYSKSISSKDLAAIRDYYPILCEKLLADGCALCCKVEGAENDVRDFLTDFSSFANLYRIVDVRTCNEKKSCMLEYSLIKPDYKLQGKEIISNRVLEIEKLFRDRYVAKHLDIQFSKNCTEGKKMFETYIGRRKYDSIINKKK